MVIALLRTQVIVGSALQIDLPLMK